MLIKLAKEAFEAASWPTTISTGRYMFPLDDNTRNVAEVKTSEEQLPVQGRFVQDREAIAAISRL